MIRTAVTRTLDDDVLRYIFLLNTYTPELESGFMSVQTQDKSALDIARHTSQVCHSWRELILNSPTIWGNIIDLEILNDKPYIWIYEVFKRTKKAKLSIYGPVGHTPRSRLLFVTLLDEHWHRVRRLDVNIKKARLFDARLWAILWKRPAPNLETFVVTGLIASDLTPPDSETSDSDSESEWINKSQLFAGSAPSLRRIHCLPNFHFHRCPAWLSRLLSLTLSAPFTAVDALNVISFTPYLESLVIQRMVDDDDEATSWGREIHLPNLRRLFVSSNLVDSEAYLTNIVPNANCALMLMIRDDLDTVNDTKTFKNLLNAVSPYARRYFNAHITTKVVIVIEDLGLRITCKTGSKEVYFGHPMFSINIRSTEDPDSDEIHQAFDCEVINNLLSILSIIPESSSVMVTRLNFTLSHSSWYEEADKSKNLQMFWSLTSVKDIVVTPWALHALDDISDSPSLFPHLFGVWIKHHKRKQNEAFKERLFRFLARRRKAGNPVQELPTTLHIPICYKCKGIALETEDLEFDDEYSSCRECSSHGVVTRIFIEGCRWIESILKS